MKITMLAAGKFIGALTVLGLVAGCTTTSPFSDSRRFSTPLAQLKPVTGSNVKSSALPPLNQTSDAPNTLTQASNSPNTLTQINNSPDPLNQAGNGAGGQDNGPGRPGDILLMPNGAPAQIGVPSSEGSLVTLEPSGVPADVATRNLAGGLTLQKLLGSWTVISGADQCKINLTQTVKSDTNRYRASAPNCTISTLSALASWQLVGSQVQFFNNSGQLIGALLQSGNRFIGTLAGGKGVSMVG
ncbi:hypothetical protein MNBD_ALPHA12-954 [hydrothermal vent metagenome]|uniref:Alkaline proteinase inhibitor/ Outer membrane lipoprotein Omp19 domain-containing protein n=1 Tax=hydrothermal vent metagenome TaxID=652676 RepID=A0A3B0TVU8_9ZZZZ